MSALVEIANAPRSLTSMRDMAVDLFAELARLTGDGVGITREAYGEGENLAHDLIRRVAVANGLRCEVDAVGNLVIAMPEDAGDRPALYLGSHRILPQGGNYDGAAGVLAALLCLIELKREGYRPKVPVRAIVLRAEESAFYGRANIGARALFGLLEARDLEAKCRGAGRSLAEAMAANGVDVARIAARETLLDPSSVLGYIELHIEQGPVMIARGLPASIVTGIRGNLRHLRVQCIGEAGHSGTVPRWLRHDSVLAFADLAMRLDEHWRVLLERGLDLVVTIGIVSTESKLNAVSRISGGVDFSFEVRSQSHDTLEAFYELFLSECRSVGKERGVVFRFDDRVYTEPAHMNEVMIRALKAGAEDIALKVELLPSGAGHDAAVFSNVGVPSGMIFIRNANGSHNPQESMDIDDFLVGMSLMKAAVVRGL